MLPFYSICPFLVCYYVEQGQWILSCAYWRMVISKVSSAYMFKPTDMLNICSVQVFFLWHCSMQAFPLMIKGLLLLLLFADACWCAIVLVMSYNLWLMWQRCWYRMLLLKLRIMMIELYVECILSLLFLRSTRNIIVNHCPWLSWESTCHTCCFCCFTGQVEAADLLSKYRLLTNNIWGCYCQSRHHLF